MVDKHVKDSKTGSKHYLPQRRHTGTWLGAPLWSRHPALEWPGPEQKSELWLRPPQELEDRQMEKVCLPNYWNICAECVLAFCTWTWGHEWDVSHANVVVVRAVWDVKRKPAVLAPALHSDLDACGLLPPKVISPSGHVVVHPGQCLQMRQTDRPPPLQQSPSPRQQNTHWTN